MFWSVGSYRIWYVAPGHLADGSEIEVLRRAPMDWSSPTDLLTAQRGFRWSLYLRNAVPKACGARPSRASIHRSSITYVVSGMRTTAASIVLYISAWSEWWKRSLR